MKLEYPAKIILAWGEAISGNSKIRDWLMKNGYPELGLFVFALHNQDEPRKWLMENKQQHLMALIRGAEGDGSALMWLRKHKLDLLDKMAQVGDNKEEAMIWLVNNGHADLANVAMRIRTVKNEIQDDNNDVHKMNLS